MKIKLLLLLLAASVFLFSCTRDIEIPTAFEDDMLYEEEGSSGVEEELSPTSAFGVLLEDAGEVGLEDDSSEYDPDAQPPVIGSGVMNSPWREFTDAPIQNTEGNRSADAYLSVILQFDVANSYKCRYQPGCEGMPSDTRCNIFASDVMNAMGAPLPTKGDLGVGHGDSKNTDPMPANANDTYSWLEKEQDGWKKIDPNNPDDWAYFMEHVASGKPAVTSYYGVGEPGHIAVVRPDQSDLAVGDVSGLKIAQAGGYNSNDTSAGTAYGSRDFNIYIHP